MLQSAGSGSAFSGFTGLKPVGSNSNTFKGFKLNTIAAATPAEGFASSPFKVNTKVEAAKLDNTSSFGKLEILVLLIEYNFSINFHYFILMASY